jgi:hypothetical protein
MRSAIATLIVATLVATPAAADQGWGRGRGQNKTAKPSKIPPGHLPPAGECRVWYDGVPPGHQPPPTSCREAERIASRDGSARVVYGDGDARDARVERVPDGERQSRGGWLPDIIRGEDRGGIGRAVPRRSPLPGGSAPSRAPSTRSRVPRTDEQEARVNSVAFDAGYREGIAQGREDARLRRRADPTRHAAYRSADRGYNSGYGSRTEYQTAFRQGFRSGYQAGYNNTAGAPAGPTGGWGSRRGGTTR